MSVCLCSPSITLTNTLQVSHHLHHPCQTHTLMTCVCVCGPFLSPSIRTWGVLSDLVVLLSRRCFNIFCFFLPVVSSFNLYFVFSQASLFKLKKYIKCLWALLLTVYSNFFLKKKTRNHFQKKCVFFWTCCYSSPTGQRITGAVYNIDVFVFSSTDGFFS